MIRRATLSDIHNLIQLLKIMWEEGAYAHIPADYDTASDWLAGLIAWPDGFVWVAEDDDGIYGAYVGQTQPHFFAKTKQAVEYVFYIHPDHRGGLSAARLVNRFCTWAKERGAIEAQVGVTVGIDNALATALYRKLGFTDFGHILRKAL
jgi:GNAT superfamily N-acetyltransferase